MAIAIEFVQLHSFYKLSVQALIVATLSFFAAFRNLRQACSHRLLGPEIHLPLGAIFEILFLHKKDRQYRLLVFDHRVREDQP